MSEYEGKYGNETERQRVRLANLVSPYRRGTKLNRIFLFMQDGNWHTLREITPKAYPPRNLGYTPEQVADSLYYRERVASALRTIRSHPNLNVRYDGQRYLLEFATQARTAAGTTRLGLSRRY